MSPSLPCLGRVKRSGSYTLTHTLSSDSRPGFCPFPLGCPEQRLFHTPVALSQAFSESEASGELLSSSHPSYLDPRNLRVASVGEPGTKPGTRRKGL